MTWSSPSSLNELPRAICGLKGNAGAQGRFVRIELPAAARSRSPRFRSSAMAKTSPPSGKATQSSTSNGGDASKAIDGNTNGLFGAGSQTHTNENERNPWWELDLGGDRSIESIVIWNRTESNGIYAKRLDNFTLTVFDSARHEIFKKTKIPAPTDQRPHPHRRRRQPTSIRRAAINALVSMPENQPPPSPPSPI
jgi:hypothetical protein